MERFPLWYKIFWIFIAIFLLALIFLPRSVFGQELQELIVFSRADFYFPPWDTPISDSTITSRASLLPSNLPKVISVENQWWSKEDKYIPKGWPIPNRNLGVGEWFGWYLHDADRSRLGADGQIDLFPVPDSVKQVWKNQKASEPPSVDSLRWGTVVDGMAFTRLDSLAVVCAKTIWLGICGQNLGIHLFSPVIHNGWVYQLGVVFDCTNHFYWKWKKVQVKVEKKPPSPPDEEEEIKKEEKLPPPPKPLPPNTTQPEETGDKWRPRLQSYAYAGIGANRVDKKYGINYTWKYAGVDVEFSLAHWLAIVGKLAWMQSTDHFWSLDREVWRPMIGIGIHQRRWIFRSLIGRDYDGREFLEKYVLEENLEVYPLRRTVVSLTGVYNNKPGNDWDYLWVQAEAKYAISVAHNNVRKLWLGAQYGWMGLPYWEKALEDEKKLPEYTQRLEALAEIEFGQKRNLVLKLTAGYGSQSVGTCGSATIILRLK